MLFIEEHPVLSLIVLTCILVFTVFLVKQYYERHLNKMLQEKHYSLRVHKPVKIRLYSNFRVLTTATLVPVLVIVFIISYNPKDDIQDPQSSVLSSTHVGEIINDFNLEESYSTRDDDTFSDSNTPESSEEPAVGDDVTFSDEYDVGLGAVEVNSKSVSLAYEGDLYEVYQDDQYYYLITVEGEYTVLTVYNNDGNIKESSTVQLKGEYHSSSFTQGNVYIATYIELPKEILDSYDSYLPEYKNNTIHTYNYDEIEYYEGVNPNSFLTIYQLDVNNNEVLGYVLLADYTSKVVYTAEEISIELELFGSTDSINIVTIVFHDDHIEIK